MIFIDANLYLPFYCGEKAKKLLPALAELRDYIFVTTQIVSEVDRQKVKLAKGLFAKQLKNKNMELKHSMCLHSWRCLDECENPPN
jgi:hypothetical protein